MTDVGKMIIEGLEDALAHAKGEAVNVRETLVHVPTDVDVQAIRQSLGLTQAEFAIRYGFSAGSIKNWEQGRREPDGHAKAYLKVIAKNHEAVEEALEA